MLGLFKGAGLVKEGNLKELPGGVCVLVWGLDFFIGCLGSWRGLGLLKDAGFVQGRWTSQGGELNSTAWRGLCPCLGHGLLEGMLGFLERAGFVEGCWVCSRLLD